MPQVRLPLRSRRDVRVKPGFILAAIGGVGDRPAQREAGEDADKEKTNSQLSDE